ncbi:alpha/beta fold hydrolase [Mycobacteroides abscessus]|uniref:alpha/beta fold hydrolase n=1 Tax=Mycobacteroides abscessus TaxID=36809 RepID=UPI000E69AB21|nr:alpha/beta hydrolase [Mycobacteroides abscessus]RIT55086.1 alpha/beta hydrolase [Mycobacteroides abscessus]
MTTSRHALLIHGTWCTGDSWAAARTEFEKRGFTVHTPTNRFHELPLLAGSHQIAKLSLTDYADDLIEVAESLDSPPLIVGLSMGGLLAQLVAARTPHMGVIAGAPAPAAGIFNMYPAMFRLFYGHFLQLSPWTKPLYPTWERFRWGAASTLPEEEARQMFNTLVTESGRAYCEMGFPWLDRAKAARVDFSRITKPVLVISGDRDRIVAPAISRKTAARYANGTHVSIPGADHMVFDGKALPQTMQAIDSWLAPILATS